MIGLIYLFAFAIYLGLFVWVVRLVMSWARASGRNFKRWGVFTGLFMYLVVFWDHIPTVVIHKYYCETKAGMWIYKNVNQWKIENPGASEILTWKNISPQYYGADGSLCVALNERFVWARQQYKTFLLPVYQRVETITDIKTGDVAVKRISVWSGYGSLALGGDDWKVIKIWVKSAPCILSSDEFYHYITIFKEIGKNVSDGKGSDLVS